MRANLPAVGQSYKHHDLLLSAQTTKNWLPEINQETTTTVSLQPFHGASVFSAGSGNDRGFYNWNGVPYKVTDGNLYKLNKNGTQTLIGIIAGSGRCSFSANEFNLVIVSGGVAYSYDGATLTLNTSPNLESPNYATQLNNQWIYQGVGNRWASSDAGLPLTINGLSYAAAESDGDPLVRPYAFDQLVYFFGTETIEPWYNSGVGDPPFDRIEQGIIQTGLGAADSVAHNDKVIYFLGDDKLVYRLAGSEAQSVSSTAIAQAFNDYDDVSKAIGYTLTLNSQQLYIINIPNTATWIFNESAGAWSELTTSSNDLAYPATGHVYAYNKHLIADGGNILELDKDLNTYNGDYQIKERVTGLISGALFGEQFIGKKLFMSRLEIIAKVKSAVSVNPVVMVDWSDDAGETWSNRRYITLDKNGEYNYRAKLTGLGSFYNRVFRFRISDDCSMSLHRVTGDIKVGNR